MLNTLTHGVQAPQSQKAVIKEYEGGVKFWNGGSSLTVFWESYQITQELARPGRAHRQVNGPSEEGSQGYLVTSLGVHCAMSGPALRDENGMPMAAGPEDSRPAGK